MSARVRSIDVPTEEVVAFLAFLTGWNGGTVPVYLDAGPVPAAHLSSRGLGVELHRRAAAWDLDGSRQVEIGLPEDRRGRGVSSATVLSVGLESREQAWWCMRRLPRPSLALRFGQANRRLLLWACDAPVPAISAEAANRKIAYACGAPYRMADPDRLRIPVPGTFLRVGRVRPAPVLVTAMDPEVTFSRAGLVGRLRDPPASWVQRQRESGAWR